MILVRAPLRISFVGGGTDQADFYRQYPGRVISSTINKYVYLSINPTPLIKQVSIRYSKTETVNHPSELEHTRFKAALLDLGIKSHIEVGSFASLPAKTGLGSSSSFSTALLKGLHAYLGKHSSSEDMARAACRLEINLLQEPIGKQDQYAAAYGGFNIFQFNADESVIVEPVLLDYRKRALLESHLLLLFTGLTKDSTQVLAVQKSVIGEHLETYKQMADSVFEFQELLLSGNMPGIARMLNQGWERKRGLASTISNSILDTFYQVGIGAGAWGGKVLGAGGGGCLLFVVPPGARNQVKAAVAGQAGQYNLIDFQEIPFTFTQSGTDVIFTAEH